MVGLTGGIGAGKSTVAQRLVENGAVLIDSDVLARQVISAGSDGAAELHEIFGPNVLLPNGEVDRVWLAERVFDDVEARQRLEGVIHPRVRAASQALTASASDDSVIVNDIPLLVEVELHPTFDLVVVVDATETIRVRRLIDRGMTEADARARMHAQAPSHARNAVADVVLDNSGDIDQIRAAVDDLWRERLVPFEANKRNRIPVTTSTGMSGRDRDNRDGVFRRLAERLFFVVGSDITIDHIDRNSSSDSASCGIIEVILTLPKTAVISEVEKSLTLAGFPRVVPSSLSVDHAHVGTDPGRPCRIDIVVER